MRWVLAEDQQARLRELLQGLDKLAAELGDENVMLTVGSNFDRSAPGFGVQFYATATLSEQIHGDGSL